MTTGNCYATELLLYYNGSQTVDCKQCGTGLWTLITDYLCVKNLKNFFRKSKVGYGPHNQKD